MFHDVHLSLNIRKSKTDQYRRVNVVVAAKCVTTACPVTMSQVNKQLEAGVLCKSINYSNCLSE